VGNRQDLTIDLIQKAAESNAAFSRSLEDWLMAISQTQFGKSDEAIIAKVGESYKNGMLANCEYHEDMANILKEDEPVIARQHRLLAKIYAALAGQN